MINNVNMIFQKILDLKTVIYLCVIFAIVNRVAAAEKELGQVMATLRQKQQNLADVEAHIARLEATYDTSLAEKATLEDTMQLCSARLGRAGRLTMALGDEQIRWDLSVKVSHFLI